MGVTVIAVGNSPNSGNTYSLSVAPFLELVVMDESLANLLSLGLGLQIAP